MADLRLHEVYLDVVYVLQPVTVVTVGATITTTNRPLVSWVNTLDADGGSQTQYEVKVFTDGQYLAGGFDPASSIPFETTGIVASVGHSWTPTLAQPNDTYRAYVRVSQTVNGAQHWSAWAFDEYVINVVLPAVPTLTLTPSNTLGRIKIDLDDNSGSATTDAFEVERSLDGGATWQTVRQLQAGPLIPAGGLYTLYDYEAPNGVATLYRARALHNYSGLYASSAWTATASATWTSTDWWLKHPSLPVLNMVVVMDSFPTTKRAARQGVLQPLGATYPLVVTDTRAGRTGTVTVRLDSAAEQAALDTLLNTLDTLLLQGPVADGEPDRYIQIGDQDRSRLADKSFVTARYDTLPFTEVAKPDDDVAGTMLTNYVTNPSVETNITGWTNSGTAPTTFAQSTFHPFAGTKALRLLTTLANSSAFTEVVTPTPGAGTYLTPGQTYAFQQRVFVGTTNGGNIDLFIDWLDASGTLISTTQATFVNNVAGSRVLSVSGVAPALTGGVSLRTRWRGFGAGATSPEVWIDGAQFSQGVAAAYFDGSFADAAWTGTAHASTSVAETWP